MLSSAAPRKVYRVTGPPENFITAMIKAHWAVNESNRNTWEKLGHGDVLLFHSTRKSGYSNTVKSAIVGYACVGEIKRQKSEFWWIQEINEKENKWPYVFSLDRICLLQDLSGKIDLTKEIHDKPNTVIQTEVEALSNSGIPISLLNKKAKSQDNNNPNFPVNGSISSVNAVYPTLFFSELADEFYQCHGQGIDELLEEGLISSAWKQELAQRSKEDLIEEAKNWANTGLDHTSGWRKTRREDAKQKKLIAEIENNKCQVCGFYCEFKNKRGETHHVIHVDHIIEKSKGGDESLTNLWVLCPNCHGKKTAGIIKIDVKSKIVTELDETISITDHHLFV